LARIEYIVSKHKIDVIIPTLDAEVILYIRLGDELSKLGIHTYLPTEDAFCCGTRPNWQAISRPKESPS
jgi:carbamoyl-phosphate synthase large subunit